MGKAKSGGEEEKPMNGNGVQNNHHEEEEKSTENRQFVQPDGGWGWVVCFTSMCANGIVFGILNTFGILYVAMKKQYGGEDNSFRISLVGSVCSGLTFLLSMFASILSDRFGIRKVSILGSALAFTGMLSSAFVDNIMVYYLTYGVMIGTGFANIYAPSLVILGHYFKRKMGVANGLVTFGSALFTIAYALTLPVLLEKVDLKYTMVCLSGVIFLLLPCSFTWKPLMKWESRACPSTMPNQSEEEQSSGCHQCVGRYLNLSIWRKRGYVVWVITRTIAFFGYFVPFTHLVQYTNDNFPGSDGNLLPMFMSIASGISRILFGFLVDFQYVSIIRMEQAGLISLGVATVCIPFADSFTTLIIVCLIMGVCDGVLICLIGPLAFDLVGKDGASQAIGFLFSLMAIPMTFGPPLAGLCYDLLGTYNVAFHAAGAPSIFAAFLIFLIPKHTELPGQHQELAGVSQSITVSATTEGESPESKPVTQPCEKCELFTITQPATPTDHKDQEADSTKLRRKDAPRCSERVDGILMNDITLSQRL